MRDYLNDKHIPFDTQPSLDKANYGLMIWDGKTPEALEQTRDLLLHDKPTVLYTQGSEQPARLTTYADWTRFISRFSPQEREAIWMSRVEPHDPPPSIDNLRKDRDLAVAIAKNATGIDHIEYAKGPVKGTKSSRYFGMIGITINRAGMEQIEYGRGVSRSFRKAGNMYEGQIIVATKHWVVQKPEKTGHPLVVHRANLLDTSRDLSGEYTQIRYPHGTGLVDYARENTHEHMRAKKSNRDVRLFPPAERLQTKQENREPHLGNFAELEKAANGQRHALAFAKERAPDATRIEFAKPGYDYNGPIIGTNSTHLLQEMAARPRAVVLHELRKLTGAGQELAGKLVKIDYPHGEAGLVRELRPEAELARRAERENALDREIEK